MNNGRTEINEKKTLLQIIQDYSFLPKLSFYSFAAVLESQFKNEFPQSWDRKTSIAVALLKSSFQYKKNSTLNIRKLQDLAVSPVPADITVESMSFTYTLSSIYEMETIGKQFYNSQLPDIPYEYFPATKKTTCNAEWVYKTQNAHSKNIILYFHGGAYFCGSLKTHRMIAYTIARETGGKVFMVDYRLAPDNPFPAALHDMFAAYQYLLNPAHEMFCNVYGDRGEVQAENIIFMGDSAGGGLATSLITYLKDFLKSEKGLQVDLPAGACLFSPWLDLSCSSASWIGKVNHDYLPTCPPLGYFFDIFEEEGGNPVMWYTAGRKANLVRDSDDIDSGYEFDQIIEEYEAIKLVFHPLVSPYFSNLSGMPPIYIQAGGVEVIRDETVEFVHMLHKANPHKKSSYRQELYEDMPHVFQSLFWTQQAKTAFSRAGLWVKTIWEKQSPESLLFMNVSFIKTICGKCTKVNEEKRVESPIHEMTFLDSLSHHPFF